MFLLVYQGKYSWMGTVIERCIPITLPEIGPDAVDLVHAR
jgi:hypothetical protein